MTLYAVWHATGWYAFRVTQKEIDRFPSLPKKNLLIKQSKFIHLYRLKSGEFQVNTYARNEYVFPGLGGAPATIAQLCSANTEPYYKLR